MDNYGYPISERNQDDQEQDSYQSSSSYHQVFENKVHRYRGMFAEVHE